MTVLAIETFANQ